MLISVTTAPQEPYMMKIMLSRPHPLLALGKLAWPLTGHCSKKDVPDRHRRTGPSALGMAELAPPTLGRYGSTTHHRRGRTSPDGTGIGKLALLLA